MARNKMGVGRKSLVALIALMGLASTGHSNYIPANHNVSVRTRDAINKLPEAPRPVEMKKSYNGDNPFKYYRKEHRNQRQYRKWMRQMPTLRRSKKCRLN